MTQYPIVKYQTKTKEKIETEYLCLKIDIYPKIRVKREALNQKKGAMTTEYIFFNLNGQSQFFK